MKNINLKKIKEGQSIWKGLLFENNKCIGIAPMIEKKYLYDKETKLKEGDKERLLYEAKVRYETEELSKVKEAIKELKTEIDKDWTKERRLAYLKIRIPILTRKSREMEADFDRRSGLDQPSWFKFLLLELQRYGPLNRKIKNWTIEKYILENPSVKVDRVTENEIIRANQFPFNQLIKFNKTGFAICPFHKEKTPSFHFHKSVNKGYCFGCGWTGGPINFLMETKNISFKKAVRALL